jgi:hypothetical protein
VRTRGRQVAEGSDVVRRPRAPAGQVKVVVQPDVAGVAIDGGPQERLAGRVLLGAEQVLPQGGEQGRPEVQTLRRGCKGHQPRNVVPVE